MGARLGSSARLSRDSARLTDGMPIVLEWRRRGRVVAGVNLSSRFYGENPHEIPPKDEDAAHTGVESPFLLTLRRTQAHGTPARRWLPLRPPAR